MNLNSNRFCEMASSRTKYVETEVLNGVKCVWQSKNCISFLTFNYEKVVRTWISNKQIFFWVRFRYKRTVYIWYDLLDWAAIKLYLSMERAKSWEQQHSLLLKIKNNTSVIIFTITLNCRNHWDFMDAQFQCDFQIQVDSLESCGSNNANIEAK